MDKILQANLRKAASYGNLYDVIEVCYGIRLETAQKSHLLNALQQGEHGDVDSLFNFIVLYLQEMGYKSKQLDDGLLEMNRNINYWARVLVIVKEINNRISFPICQGKNFRKFISIDINDYFPKFLFLFLNSSHEWS